MEQLHNTILGKVPIKMIGRHGGHTCNASTWDAEAVKSATNSRPALFAIANSRASKATYCGPISNTLTVHLQLTLRFVLFYFEAGSLHVVLTVLELDR